MQRAWIIGCLFFPGLLWAQQQDEVVILTELKAQTETSGVAVSFTLGKGSFCYGAQLQKTQDTNNLFSLVNVGSIEGVCGSQDFETSYTLFDESPYRNRVNYYRVIMGTIPSHFIAIEYREYGSQDFLIYPVPAVQGTQLFVSNRQRLPVDVRYFDTNGRLQFEQTNQRTDAITVPVDQLGSGLRIVQVWRNGRLLGSQTIVVQ